MSKSSQRNRPHSAKRKESDRRRTAPGNWLWGTHAVEAALANPKRRIHTVLATSNAGKRLQTKGHRVQEIEIADLHRILPQSAVHQGIAAQVDPLPDVPLEDLIANGAKRIAILDQVSDPQNLGAIFRSASAFGFEGIVLQTKNAPAISGVVAKAAVGAVERVPECRVVNIARALDALGEAGFHTIGLAGGGRSDIQAAIRGAAKVAIVLGAEGPGLRPAVAKACAELAHIPISDDMESLNVSTAAAIAFYEAARAE